METSRAPLSVVLDRRVAVWKGRSVRYLVATVFALQRRNNTDEGRFGALKDRQLLDVGASVHVGYVGASVDLRPTEMLDFILGFFLLDFRDDDFETLDPIRSK